MSYKWIGAILIIASSSSVGFSIVFHQKKEESMIAQLETILDKMLLELPFQLTPLPDLIRHAADHSSGVIKRVLFLLGEQLDRQVLPDAASCMEAALEDAGMKEPHTRRILSLMGQSLGRFDLSGQIKDLTAVKMQCAQELANLRTEREKRLESYRILGICAGIALVILLI